MNTQEVLDVFRSAGAVLEGHFILTSGLRSPVFLQKARVFMHADKTEKLCRALAEKIRGAIDGRIDYVVGPAIGGLIPAYETSRHLGVPAIWVEREQGVFRLRRFEIEKGARVVIVEDIVTTGLSIRETIECLRDLGAEVVAAACQASGSDYQLVDVDATPELRERFGEQVPVVTVDGQTVGFWRIDPQVLAQALA